jgi:RHS repeat-associated protein
MGTKHHKIVNDIGTETNTWYLNGFQYNDNGLEFFATEEGRVVRDVPFGQSGQNGQFRYEYNYKDHLGNLRLSFSDLNFDNSIDATTEVLQEVNYYPFGLEHSYSADDLPPLSGAENQYKYNGKEKQTEIDLNWSDYGARMPARQKYCRRQDWGGYDPAVGRWNGIDELSQEYFALSPYVYTANNPILYIDPDGRYFIVNNEEQQQAVINALATAFNNQTDAFSFDKDGKLSIDKGKLGDLSKDQKFLFKTFNKGIVKSKSNTMSVEISSDGKTKTDINSNGNFENGETNININQDDFMDKVNDTENGTVTSDNSELTDTDKTALALFHEIGHFREEGVFNTGNEKKDLQRAVGYENVYRSVRGYNPRVGNLHGKNVGGVYKYTGNRAPTGYGIKRYKKKNG